MKRALLGVAAFVLSLTLAGPTQAHGPRSYRAPAVGAYYARHGVPFRGGYYYAGQNHSHWAHRVWNARYGRYHYYDPYLRCYYYWSPAGNCYYPVGYAPF